MKFIENRSIRVAIGLAAIIVVFVALRDVIIENVMTLLGLGSAAAVAVGARKARKAKADEHEDMADIRLIESVKEVEQAEEAFQKASDIAASVKEPDRDKIPPDFKPTGSRTRR